MKVIQRIDILEKLGHYILSEEPDWLEATDLAGKHNNWFIPDFIKRSVNAIAVHYLNRSTLEKIAETYSITELSEAKTVGIVMAGNLPLVGFHDFCCAFLAGRRAVMKLSSQDNILLPHLVKKMIEWEPAVAAYIHFADMLKGCDAYIATGSNQSSVYFEHYFGKYPHIIRRNRTAAAILTGNESKETLDALADDVHLYFGRGCRSVTKLYVPEGYDFIPLLENFKRYGWLADHHKFKNNYDYQLALLILNKNYYMTNGTLLLKEEPSLFAPIGMLHYEYYKSKQEAEKQLTGHPDVQCVVGEGLIPFGHTQQPAFTDFADGIDTLQFLLAN